MRGEALVEALSREARKVNGKKIEFFTIVTEAITDLLFGHLASLQVHKPAFVILQFLRFYFY